MADEWACVTGSMSVNESVDQNSCLGLLIQSELLISEGRAEMMSFIINTSLIRTGWFRCFCPDLVFICFMIQILFIYITVTLSDELFYLQLAAAVSLKVETERGRSLSFPFLTLNVFCSTHFYLYGSFSQLTSLYKVSI